MLIRLQWALFACALLSFGCSFGCSAPTLATRREAASPAITALQRGQFEEAERLARGGMAADADNPYTRLVRAITRYKKVNQQLMTDGMTLLAQLERGSVNQKYLQTTLLDAEAALAEVDADLAAAGRHEGIALELCLACWEVDWNGNGRIDSRDERLFEIEMDDKGEPLPEGDPRRRPTFRFDDGDVLWARAFVSFERAAIDVLLAYDWSGFNVLGRRRRDMPKKLVIPLADAGRIAAAKQRILEGLAWSDASRVAYLAETDDDREWVPSPRQKNHPMPMPVDKALYETWEGVVKDVRGMIQGDTCLSIAGLVELHRDKQEDQESIKGCIDLGRMLARPKDISLDLAAFDRLFFNARAQASVKELFGEYYSEEKAHSPITGRLLRMKGEIDRGEGEFDRKLRYLLWLN